MFAYLTAWMVFTTDGADAPELLALFGVWEAMAATIKPTSLLLQRGRWGVEMAHSVELQTAAIFSKKNGRGVVGVTTSTGVLFLETDL